MAEFAPEEKVTLKIVIDEAKNRVVFAEAGKDFVDVLLNFLTLPLGTIARLVSKESNINKLGVGIGSLSSLYDSVANLEVKHFLTETCKEMLLQPRNSMEAYCQKLKLNVDDTENTKYFICGNWGCTRNYAIAKGLLSTFRNKRCKCGNIMNREISSPSSFGTNNNEGFIKEITTFIISDDLKVMPKNFLASVLVGSGEFTAIKEVSVDVTQKKIVDLLRFCMISKTPLTDLFMTKKHCPRNVKPRYAFELNIGEPEVNVGEEMMKVNVMLRKSNGKILFALAEEEFVDFLFSFLTFPLGAVEQMFEGNSCAGCIDNLYKSIVDLDGCKYLKSLDIKEKLLKPRLAHQFKLQKQLLPIDEVPTSNYCCCSKYNNRGELTCYLTVGSWSKNKKETYTPLSYLQPQSSTGDIYNSSGGRGFVDPSLYMVTDDLVVTPSSSMSAISFLADSRVPSSDLEERVISIGKKEGLSLLKASLISSSALTNGLGQFIKAIKLENIAN